MGVQDSRVYLSRQVNNILQVFGSNVKISGLDITINNDAKLINNKIASFTISPGKCIVDTTLHIFPTATTLELDVSPYDSSGYLVIVVSYKYIETLQQNRPVFKLLYVTSDGLDQLPDAWSPNRDNLVLGVFKFNNQSLYDIIAHDGNIISVNNNTYTINPISDTIGCQHYLGGSDSEPDCNRCLLTDGDLYFDLVQKELFVYNGWSPIDDTFESNSNYTFELSNNYNSGTIVYTLTVVKQGTGDGTVTSSPSGINCGSICSYHFISGYSVTLTATPNSTSSFNSWSGDATSINPTVTITMNSNKTVYTTFTINEAGYFAGGWSGSVYYSYIDKLLFSNDSRSTLSVVLSQSVGACSACNSTSAGYFAGGGNGNNQSSIDKLLFSNESRSTLTATLSQTVGAQSACNSTLAGYFAGGTNNDDTIHFSYIDKLLFSNESRTILTATLSVSIRSQAACNSSLAGYFAGGFNHFLSSIDKLLFSNESRTTLTATLSQSVEKSSACNSSLSGYFAGGANGAGDSNLCNFIDKLLFSNETRTTLAAILSSTIYNQSSCNSTLSGYFAGGMNYNNGYNYQSYIDKLLFSDETRTTLISTLSRSVQWQAACQSGGIV
jgi:hypothetical protein